MGKSITAVIQARMTSSRLPGKVLLEVLGKPLLGYQLERIGHCELVDDVVLATTTNVEDDPVVDFAAAAGVKIFRGDEHDVLGRFHGAAEEYDLDNVMRLTADCPLLDPKLCDRLLKIFLETGSDYAHTAPSVAEGLDCEVFRRGLLDEAFEKAELPSEREHVTQYFHNNRDRFKILAMENEVDHSAYRFTVDEPADFEVVKVVIEELCPKIRPYATAEQIVAFLDSRPDLMTLNSEIIRNEGLLKSLAEDREQDDNS